MNNIKRPKVSFIDKDTMTKIDDIAHIIVHVDPRDGRLTCHWFKLGESAREVEIRFEEDDNG